MFATLRVDMEDERDILKEVRVLCSLVKIPEECNFRHFSFLS